MKKIGMLEMVDGMVSVSVGYRKKSGYWPAGWYLTMKQSAENNMKRLLVTAPEKTAEDEVYVLDLMKGWLQEVKSYYEKGGRTEWQKVDYIVDVPKF